MLSLFGRKAKKEQVYYNLLNVISRFNGERTLGDIVEVFKKQYPSFKLHRESFFLGIIRRMTEEGHLSKQVTRYIGMRTLKEDVPVYRITQKGIQSLSERGRK